MDPQSLRDFLDAGVKRDDLKQKPDGSTWCNRWSKEVAKFCGCTDFEDYPKVELADSIYQFLDSNISRRWSRIDKEFASRVASEGHLVFAVLPSWQLNAAHGHIAPLYPAQMEFSESLKEMVPIIANVGKDNGIGKTSKYFPVKIGHPKFFLFVPAIQEYHG